MAQSFREFVDEQGGPEQVRGLLSGLFERDVKLEEVRRYYRGTRPAPKKWIRALGLEESPSALSPDDDGAAADAAAEGPAAARQAETPPKRPAGAETIIPRPSLSLAQQAKERISALHVFAGASLAVAVDAKGFDEDKGTGGGIAAIWKDKADPIAEAWVAWAEEGNRFAAAFVRMMGTGGAGGDLAIGYAALLGGTAYVMGQLPDNEATRVVYGRYAQFRVVPAKPARPDNAAAGAPGSGADAAAADGAADFLGGVAGSASP